MYLMKNKASLAQLVELSAHNGLVAGSNPAGSTMNIKRAYALPSRAQHPHKTPK